MDLSGGSNGISVRGPVQVERTQNMKSSARDHLGKAT